MGIKSLIEPFAWVRYSKKLNKKIENPRSAGFFTEENVAERGMRLVEGMEGHVKDGNALKLYWIVDPDDGIIVDAKFQAFGQSALIGAAEAACELLVGKNYDQAKRITVDLIDKQVRDKSDTPAFPPETYPHLNIVLEAIDQAAEKCQDIPLSTHYVAPPAPSELGEEQEGGHPKWLELSNPQKLAIIEEVLDRDIRPYIALDAGGIDVKEFKGSEVIITYKGSCTSCISSVGATLSFIQQVLRRKTHPEIRVIPDLT